MLNGKVCVLLADAGYATDVRMIRTADHRPELPDELQRLRVFHTMVVGRFKDDDEVHVQPCRICGMLQLDTSGRQLEDDDDGSMSSARE